MPIGIIGIVVQHRTLTLNQNRVGFRQANQRRLYRPDQQTGETYINWVGPQLFSGIFCLLQTQFTEGNINPTREFIRSVP